MKKLVLLALYCCSCLAATAQVTVTLGGASTGSGSTNVLLSTSTTTNRYSRTMSVYTAAEITAAGGSAGSISSLAWSKAGTGEYTTANAYIKVYLKHVSNAQWSTSPVPDWNTEVTSATPVFTSTTYSIPTGTGFKTVPFSTNFTWNGTDNVCVFVEWDRASAPTADISWAYSAATNANATRVGSTSLAALVMLVNSNRPLLQLTINSAPAVPGCVSTPVSPVNNSTTACAGTTVLRWNKVSSATTYDVYLNAGTATPTTVVSANQTDTFYNATTIAGPYKWKIVPKNTVGPATGCSDFAFTTVSSITPSVSISVAPNDTLCAGIPATFTAAPVNGGTAPTYQWRKNSTNVGSGGTSYTDNSLANNDTIRVVMTASGTSCFTTNTATSQPIVMTILPSPAATISAGSQTAFCAGGSVILSTPASGNTYQWVNNTPISGATSNTYTATVSGYYKVRVTGANGCTGTSDSIKVTSYPQPAPPVNRIGDTLFTNNNYISYQWYRGAQAIAGATTFKYVLTQNGSYSVRVTDTAGCNGTSAALPVNSLDIPAINGNTIRVYPNPSNQVVYIQSAGKVNAAVHSAEGKLVLDKKDTDRIDISSLAKGIYMLYVTDQNGRMLTVRKLVRSAD